MALTIITICYSIIILCFAFFLFITIKNRNLLYKSLKKCQKLNEDILENNRDLIQFNDKLIQENNEKSIISVYLMMSIAAKDQDYQTFTSLYQKMYFFGIKKEILDDQSKLHQFIADLMEHKIKISTGISPFEFQFEELF